jgi:hypothetical protein
MTNNLDPKPGDLRVWWIPQIPGKAFHVSVKTVDEAILLLNTLAEYDAFQYENRIKPDYCNVGGFERYDEEESAWFEWDDDAGYEIYDVIREQEEVH